VGNMRGITLILLAVALCLAVSSPVLAQEGARYNFASAQGSKQIKVTPGGEGRGSIYFYNIDGNRITHISLEVSQAPSGWEVTIEPPLSETQVLVSGLPVTVAENLYVEPSELLTEEPKNIPEGMVSIKVPGRGYALGKLVQVVIKVPETAPLGSTGEITVAAEAAWLGQGGAAAIKQAREFEFFIEVISGEKEFTETIIGEVEKTETEKPETEKQEPEKPSITQPAKTESGEGAEPEEAPPTPPPASESGPFSALLVRWLPAIIAVVVVVVAAILILIIMARRRGY